MEDSLLANGFLVGCRDFQPASSTRTNEQILEPSRGDGLTEFGIQAIFRQQAHEAYVRYDVGHRMSRATLRKVAPVLGKYRFGGIVSFCGRPRKVECGITWSIGSRTVGSERDRSDPPHETPKVC